MGATHTTSSSVGYWTAKDVSNAIRSISPEYAPYAQAFLDNGIDGLSLFSLNAKSLDELEIDIPRHHRERLLVELDKLREVQKQIKRKEGEGLRAPNADQQETELDQPHIPDAPSGAKFNTSTQYFVFGSDVDFQDGLTKKVKKLTRSMEHECVTNEKGRWSKDYDYVVNEAATEHAYEVHRVRDLGHDGMTLLDFCWHEKAVEAKLTVAEVAALRMYTGPLYEPWNRALRMYATDSSQLADWATCISVLYSAIFKLSFLSKKATVYRGVNETAVKLPESFLDASSDAFAGGVELAFMSTTTDPRVAIEYAMRGAEACGTLFEIQFDAASRGADVQWVSQYPYEAELLYPPCTYLTCESVSIVSVASLVGNATAMAHIGGDIRCVSVRAAVSTTRTDVGSITTCEAWPELSSLMTFESDAQTLEWRSGVRSFESSAPEYRGYAPRQWRVEFEEGEGYDLKRGDYVMFRGMREVDRYDPNGVWYCCESAAPGVHLFYNFGAYYEQDYMIADRGAISYVIRKGKSFTAEAEERNAMVCTQRVEEHRAVLREKSALFNATAANFIGAWNKGLTSFASVGSNAWRATFDGKVVPYDLLFQVGDYIQLQGAAPCAGSDINGIWYVCTGSENGGLRFYQPGLPSGANLCTADTLFTVRRMGAFSIDELDANAELMLQRIDVS